MTSQGVNKGFPTTYGFWCQNGMELLQLHVPLKIAPVTKLFVKSEILEVVLIATDWGGRSMFNFDFYLHFSCVCSCKDLLLQLLIIVTVLP